MTAPRVLISLADRLVVFTTVNESRFREIAVLLVEEGSAPPRFATVEYINWTGQTKNLTLVPDAHLERVLLVDDLERYVHPGQEGQWVPIHCFEPPFEQEDAELERVWEDLVRRVSGQDCR